MSAALRQLPATSAIPTAELLVIIREYLDGSRLDAAERLLGHVLDGDPRQPDALHLSGFIAFKRGRIEQAAELMERGLQSGAAATRQLCNLGEVYRLLGRVNDGLALVRRAAALSPTDPVPHFNAAMLYYDAQDTAQCISAARRAIALKPDMPEAHMRLGQTLLLTGDYAEGWEEYEWRYRIGGAQPLMPAAFVARGGTRPQWDGSTLPAGEHHDVAKTLVRDQQQLFARRQRGSVPLRPCAAARDEGGRH